MTDEQKELLNKYNRIANDKSQLEMFTKNLILGEIGGGSGSNSNILLDLRDFNIYNTTYDLSNETELLQPFLDLFDVSFDPDIISFKNQNLPIVTILCKESSESLVGRNLPLDISLRGSHGLITRANIYCGSTSNSLELSFNLSLEIGKGSFFIDSATVSLYPVEN